jgi:CBS domain-containing protein
VYDYVPGKADWLAAGMPFEGTKAGIPTAGSVARRDVATCAPDDTVAEARRRAEKAGGVCVVVNAERVVFGLLREAELASAGDQKASEAMRPGPSTFRPNATIIEMAAYMVEHNLVNCPITTNDGRLVGVLFRDDAVQAHHEWHEHHS